MQEAGAVFGQWMNMKDGMFGATKLNGLSNWKRLIAMAYNAPGVCEGERKRVLGAALFPFTGSNHLNQPFCKHHVGRSLPCRSGLRTTYSQRLVKGETRGVGQNLGLHKPLKKAADRVRMDFAAWQILTYV